MAPIPFQAKPTLEETRVQLHEAYQKAELRHNWAVSELTRQRETAHGEYFDELAQHVHKTRNEAAEALHDLKLFEV